MNKYKNTDRDIHTRIYKFVLDCYLEVVKRIPKSVESQSIISQISSSLTSIGANDQEADATSSRKDFIAKYRIVKKETKETRYWLSLIRDSRLIDRKIVEPYISECQEIILIVSSIIASAKKSNKQIYK